MAPRCDFTPKTKRGEPLKFLLGALSFKGEDCLLWPYAHIKGYGLIYLKKSRYVHRIVCTEIYGNPKEDQEVAHSCGNSLCCNPNHLRWATHIENCQDMIVHGTILRGEKKTNSKLTEDQVRMIISLKGKFTQVKISKIFNVGRTTIRNIHDGKKWIMIKSTGGDYSAEV